jgi:flagellar basal body-associated protein FliL
MEAQAKRHKKSSNKIIISTVIILLIALIVFIYYNLTQQNNLEKLDLANKEELLSSIKEVNPNVNDIIIDKKSGLVAVYINPRIEYKDNKTIVTQTAEENSPIISSLIKNSQVKKVIVTVKQVNPTTKKIERTLQASFDNTKEDISKDYHSFYNGASKYYISAEIWRALNKNDKAGFENNSRVKQ